jgi:hypothetical protein
MFFSYSTNVAGGLAEVEKSLDRVRANLAQSADVAYRDGERLSARVGPSESIAHTVHLEIGQPGIQSSGLVYPIHWTATGATMLFPELDADLILTKRGSKSTSITLRGTYRPPLGPIGRLADRAVLGRVAEATIKNWVDRLASALVLETRSG